MENGSYPNTSSLSCHSFDSFAETAEVSSSVLSNQAVKIPAGPSIFHLEFDNFDKVLNNITGRSVQTAHGIVLQDVTVPNDDNFIHAPI